MVLVCCVVAFGLDVFMPRFSSIKNKRNYYSMLNCQAMEGSLACLPALERKKGDVVGACFVEANECREGRWIRILFDVRKI